MYEIGLYITILIFFSGEGGGFFGQKLRDESQANPIR